jgi:uncharacterized protein (TIGR00297 family)
MSPLLSAAAPAILIALAAWRAHALTASGAIAAAAVGICHFYGGGWLGAGALLAFFVTSTALSRLGKRRKDTLGFEKGGRRDAAQVLANGGIAALCALLVPVGGAWQIPAMLGALAAANADTWATEIGTLWGATPRRITTLKPARPGESGAVSGAGTLAALGGAALIGLVALSFGKSLALLLAVTGAGFLGALADSLLGATVQAQWRDASGRWIERANDASGAAHTRVQGVPWFGNDPVNAAATLIGALVAALLAMAG